MTRKFSGPRISVIFSADIGCQRTSPLGNGEAALTERNLQTILKRILSIFLKGPYQCLDQYPAIRSFSSPSYRLPRRSLAHRSRLEKRQRPRLRQLPRQQRNLTKWLRNQSTTAIVNPEKKEIAHGKQRRKSAHHPLQPSALARLRLKRRPPSAARASLPAAAEKTTLGAELTPFAQSGTCFTKALSSARK